MTRNERFTVLRKSKRIWAVASINGDAAKLARLHDRIAADIRVGDRIVYLGNYFGVGPDAVDVVDELIQFRRWFLALPPCQHTDDITYLCGQQEEMWRKLMQVQFAPKPEIVLDWMLARGMDATLKSFGFDPNEALERAQEGTLALTYWTNRLREAARGTPGHDALMTGLKRAAYTDDGALLFVHTGVDVEKSLGGQADAFWWASKSFTEIDAPYGDFKRIIRGYDPDARGFVEGDYTLSIDGGCARGGTLNAALLDPDGTIQRLEEV